MRAFLMLLLLGLSMSPASAMHLEERPAPRVVAPASSFSIPERPADAVGGTEFGRRLVGLGRADREAAIVAEILRGNIPPFLRQLKPVSLRARIDGKQVRATVWVMPDYLAVGSDEDFVRVPVSYYGAVTIARTFGMALPTRKVVDAVYAQSSLRLKPQPMTPGPRMTSVNYFLVHNQRIETQRAGRAFGALIAGHKKDLVITNRLSRQRSPRVAIYGWHRGMGDPIQPLSTVHGASYADYSHGLRLLGGVMVADGVERSIFDALADDHLAAVLSLEGTVRVPAEMLPGPERSRPAAR